jgi:hypothetical protein
MIVFASLTTLRLLILWCGVVYFIPLIDEAIYIQSVYSEYAGSALCHL